MSNAEEDEAIVICPVCDVTASDQMIYDGVCAECEVPLAWVIHESDEEFQEAAMHWYAAQGYSPAVFLAEELQERGIPVDDFCASAGITDEERGILIREEPLTKDLATKIGEALDTGGELWVSLDEYWQDFRTRTKEKERC